MSPEILDQYVGIYGREGVSSKMTVIRSGSTIAIPNGANSIPLEALSNNKFQLAPGVTVEFETAKKQMTIKRPQGEAVFTKKIK